jgi:hypothetical protein
MDNILDKIKYGYPVSDWRKQTCSVRCEEKIAFAVDGAQQVGELRVLVSTERWNCACHIPGSRSSSSDSQLRVSCHRVAGMFAGTFMASTFFCARAIRAHQRRQVLLSVPSTLGPVLAEGRRAEKGDAQIIPNSTRQHRHPVQLSNKHQLPASHTHLSEPAQTRLFR